MIYQKWHITKKDCHKTPIRHIDCATFISLKTYENLYEQWNNFEHPHWKKFISENDLKITLHNNLIAQPPTRKDFPFVGYWFFKQRTDFKRRDNVINLRNTKEDKIISTQANAVLILETSANMIVRPRQGIMTIPFCEVYFDNITNEKIKLLLN